VISTKHATIFRACMNCPNRHPFCHDTCPEYIAEKAQNDEIRKKRALGNVVYDYKNKIIEKEKRRSR